MKGERNKKNLPTSFQIIILVLFSIFAGFITVPWGGSKISAFIALSFASIYYVLTKYYTWFVKLNENTLDLSNALNLIFYLVGTLIISYNIIELWNNGNKYILSFNLILFFIGIILIIGILAKLICLFKHKDATS